jgi:RNA polymerase sigma factor (sigma-70 family)
MATTDEQRPLAHERRVGASVAAARQEANWVALLRAGGNVRQGAIKGLYDKYGHQFKQFFRRHRLSLETAEDLLQDTFVRIVHGLESYRSEGTFEGWIWAIARNTLMSHLRERKTEVSLDAMETHEVDELLTESQPSGSNPAAADCVKRSFGRYMKAQPECADALVRVVVDGWGYAELAQFRHSTYGATREYLSQCRKRLMEFVQPCFELAQGR